MSKQEVVPYEAENLVRLPPVPIFDEHIEALDLEVRNFTCRTEDDFRAGKEIANKKLLRLKVDIVASYQPVKRACDELKQPILDAEKQDLAKITAMLAFIDAECVPWKQEQDRLAQVAANQRREAERQRLEAERLAKLEAARAAAKVIEDQQIELEKQRAAELELAKDWAGEAEVKAIEDAPARLEPEQAVKLASAEAEIRAIEAAPAVMVRPVTIESEFSYRRGGKVKPKLTYRVSDPKSVKRQFCEPSKIAIDVYIRNYGLQVKEPTTAQLAALAEEIGGVVVEWT